MEKPANILFLMTDQHRFDVCGFNGNGVVRTPVLDALAKDAVIFENCYTPSPVCIPARQAMMAGQYPRTCGCERFGEDLTPFYNTFARHLAEEGGYDTVCSGKLHHTGADQMQGWTKRIAGDMQCGSNSRYAPSRAEQRWTTAKEISHAGIGEHRHTVEDEFAAEGAINYIREHFCSPYYDKQRPGVPLLLKFSQTRPHYPYLADEKRFCYYLNRVQPYLGQEPCGHPVLDRKLIEVGRDVTERDAVRATAAYYAMVEQADAAIGRITDALSGVGQDLDEWIIIFAADHGDMLGQHSVWMKHCFYEGSVKVPMFIRYPKRFGAKRVRENVNLCDLYATLCELSGIETPEGLDSRSLVPLLGDGAHDWDNESISQYGGEYVMIKRDDLKYQFYGDRAEEVLFDLKRNPEETVNYAKNPDYAQQMEQFRKRAARMGFAAEGK